MDYDDIKVGNVLHLHCEHCTPPKLKYFIVVTTDPAPILLFINSELNNYVSNNVHLHPCHISIKEYEHVFLHHDSWVNCCEPCLAYSIDSIERDLKYGGRYCGSLSTDGIASIIMGIKNSPVIKRKTKKRILESLS